MKKNLFTLILFSLLIFSCRTSNNPSIKNNVVKEDNFIFGRIKIYRVYNEKKMRDISSRCYIINQSIEKSALSDIGLDWKRFHYFFEHGLFAFKTKDGQDLIISNISCDDYGFKRNRGIQLNGQHSSIITLRNLILKLEKNEYGVRYFGDIDVFISSDPDDKKIVYQFYRGSKYPLYRSLFYDKSQVFISNNLDETYSYLSKIFPNINTDKSKILYQPMSLMEENETKAIPQSKKRMPF